MALFRKRGESPKIGGMEVPVVAIMLLLIFATIMAFDGLKRQPSLEIQIPAFIGVLLLAIDAIASGTTSVRDRKALLALAWGVTGVVVAVVGMQIAFGSAIG